MNADLKDSLPILEQGDISLEGQFLWGSNYTLLVKVALGEKQLDAVYKPIQGERPLWDFPRESLAMREVAAYLVSDTLGWVLVPPTVYRNTAPYGPGSLQLFVEHDPDYHFFNFTSEDKDRLRPVALFDVLINNADRKGGHVIVDQNGHIWLIDHGVCFHRSPKLRTVIWDFAGDQIPQALCEDIYRLRQQLESGQELASILERYLSISEIQALTHRADRLLSTNIFPHPPQQNRPYPWPLV